MTRGTWETVPTIGEPTARHENGFVFCNDAFYLIGGRRDQPVFRLDAESLAWSQLSPPPLEIHHFQPIVIGDDIWLVGAMTGEFPVETPLPRVIVYHTRTDTWSEAMEIPEDRRRGSSGAVLHDDGWIYIAGGIVDGHRARSVTWFDRMHPQTGAWEQLPDTPRKRDHAPVAVVDGKLYFLGGRETGRDEGTDPTYSNFNFYTRGEVDVYDFDAGTWSTLAATLPVQTTAGCAGIIDGKIVYAGGESGVPEAHDETQLLDPKTGTIELAGPLQRARHGTMGCVHDGALWVAAGSGAQGGNPELNTVERFTA